MYVTGTARIVTRAGYGYRGVCSYIRIVGICNRIVNFRRERRRAVFYRNGWLKRISGIRLRRDWINGKRNDFGIDDQIIGSR